MRAVGKKFIALLLLGFVAGLMLRPTTLEASARKRYCELDYCASYTFCRTTNDLTGCDHTGLPCKTYNCAEE